MPLSYSRTSHGFRVWWSQRSSADPVTRFEALSCLAEEFREEAKKIGQIIIAELYLSEQQRTIKPAALGGIAGGEKYVQVFCVCVWMSSFLSSPSYS